MIFEGKIDLDVPAAKTWDFLIDINKFSSCLPGLQEVKQIDDKTFDGVIAANVGPISGKFSFRAMIVESKPPEQMVVKTEGTVKDEMSGQEVNEEGFFSDYKDVQGTKQAHKFSVKRAGKLFMEGESTKVELFDKLDASTFAKP